MEGSRIPTGSSRRQRFRQRLYEIIFEADTPAGRLFDIVLLVSIVISVLAVMLESVTAIRAQYAGWLIGIEWFFTVLFTLEYLARLYTVQRKRVYATSFLGIVDLLSILPTYLALFFTGAQSLMVIRSVRLLRIFRILKLPRFIGESQSLVSALKSSRHKIIVFLLTVVTTVIIMGTIMYLVEGPENGYTSIPRSIYWSVVTMTTVGYGDIAPRTDFGQFLAAMLMINGYGVIAVTIGIFSVEIISLRFLEILLTHCVQNFHKEDHDIV